MRPTATGPLAGRINDAPRLIWSRVREGTVRSGRRIAVTATLVAAFGNAHGETRPRYGRKIVGSMLGQPATLDPVRVKSHAEAQLARE